MTITGALGFTIRVGVMAAAAYIGFQYGALWFAGWKLGSLSLGSFASSAVFITANELATKYISQKLLKDVLSTEVAAVLGAVSLASLSMHAVSLVFGILKFVTSPFRSKVAQAPDPAQALLGQLGGLINQLGLTSQQISGDAQTINQTVVDLVQAKVAADYLARNAFQQQPAYVPHYGHNVYPQGLGLNPYGASAPPQFDREDTENGQLHSNNRLN